MYKFSVDPGRFNKCFLTSEQTVKGLPKQNKRVKGGGAGSYFILGMVDFMKHQLPRYTCFWTVQFTRSSFKGGYHLFHNFIKEQCSKLGMQK